MAVRAVVRERRRALDFHRYHGTPRHQRDRLRPRPEPRDPQTAPISAPSKSTDGSSNATGMPSFANHPAATLHTANCDPTEMSISPTRITSVIPTATSSTGALFNARSRRFPAPKNVGDATPTATNSATYASAADTSRL